MKLIQARKIATLIASQMLIQDGLAGLYECVDFDDAEKIVDELNRIGVALAKRYKVDADGLPATLEEIVELVGATGATN